MKTGSWIIVCSTEETVRDFSLYLGVKLPRRQILCLRIIFVLYVTLITYLIIYGRLGMVSQ